MPAEAALIGGHENMVIRALRRWTELFEGDEHRDPEDRRTIEEVEPVQASGMSPH